MPKGEHLDRAHQQRSSLLPRPGSLKPSAGRAERERQDDESLEDATLRLQVARADTEELDRQKREMELGQARGLLVTKEEAIDLAQAAVLRVCQILDLIPEKLRDKLAPDQYAACDFLDQIITDARTEVANG